VDKAYIIRVKGNDDSEKQALNCAASCNKVGMPFQYWDAYNGISDEIIVPEHHNSIMKMIKVTDHYLTRGEVACALSHISLWAKCVEQDQPLVILEHDTVMTAAYTTHHVFNSIAYLGSNEQAYQGWGIFPTPNYHFICRAHSYAIDPAVAKNMLAHVLKFGITAPLDIILRADIFPIHQMGMYAHDLSKETTTILGRPLEGRKTTRNDFLKD
jgi:hypothetical protein